MGLQPGHLGLQPGHMGLQPGHLGLQLTEPKCADAGAGGAGSTPWASADERFLLLADVALGVARDFGPAEPNIKVEHYITALYHGTM